MAMFNTDFLDFRDLTFLLTCAVEGDRNTESPARGETTIPSKATHATSDNSSTNNQPYEKTGGVSTSVLTFFNRHRAKLGR
jgi:hypothetical protein